MLNFWELFNLHRKFLVYNLVMRNLKVKYRRSALGFLWTLLVPMSQAAIYYVVFLKILKIQIAHYVPFILSGVLVWTFFSNTLTEAMESLLNNSNLLTKIPVPLQTFPWVAALSHAINLGLALPVIVLFMLLDGLPITPAFVLVLPILFATVIIAFAIGLTFALVMVFFRDLRYVLALVLQVWLYATPVFYNESMIPKKLEWMLWLNPIGLVFTSIHGIILDGRAPATTALLGVTGWTVVSILISRRALAFSLRRGVTEWL